MLQSIGWLELWTVVFPVLPEMAVSWYTKIIVIQPGVARNLWLSGYLRMRQVFRRQVFRKG